MGLNLWGKYFLVVLRDRKLYIKTALDQSSNDSKMDRKRKREINK